jgi:lipopolysaccharide/colanic/teichoic acid biosynthesis glycosyltransferase
MPGNQPGFRRDLFDRTAGLAGLVVFSPLWIPALAAILAEDGAPGLYRQQRIGRNGVPFLLWKLRSMRNTVNNGPQITASNDNRITRTGRVIRKYKIDELPQFWNLFTGHMSLVGPRPEVPRYVDLADPTWQRVLAVRPGITDLATLVYRNEEELLAAAPDPERYYRDTLLKAKLRLNLEYLEHRTWWTDLKLIALTARYSFFPGGFDSDKVRQLLLA